MQDLTVTTLHAKWSDLYGLIGLLAVATVVFVLPDGAESAVAIDQGVSIMEGALRGGIDGIDADCGGEMACATCHIKIPEPWWSRISAPSAEEIEMLDFAVGVDEHSRLSCQVIVSDGLDGLIALVPQAQR